MDNVCADDPNMNTHICGGSRKEGPAKSGSGGNGASLGKCGTSCSSNDECSGKLACMSSFCGDDPDVGTSICGSNGNDNSGSNTGNKNPTPPDTPFPNIPDPDMPLPSSPNEGPSTSDSPSLPKKPPPGKPKYPVPY
ncbi:chitin-binding lectin 1-like [Selaginella moellendorffii]|uniref:chitin-binding lectin 1-like n=1 Tax=Selaginella moellendorffii TaxID=88036 RepID=UPI000D1CB9AA|nr:chitin-binding lectin 1-like [Selaginella moellendorffii]|eukprot:XP_024535885.1 chitin-binding lectin 1-like [Selaginella moellendorffii]